MPVPSNTVFTDGGPQVTGDNLNSFIQSCFAVADARAFIGVSGMQLLLMGFSSPNDGGQGSFYWNDASTATDDGGVTTIIPYGSALGAWTRSGPFVTQALRATLAVNQTGVGPDDIIVFNSVTFGPAGIFNIGNGHYQPQTPGKYLITGTVGIFGQNVNDAKIIGLIKKNGADVVKNIVATLPPVFSDDFLTSATATGIVALNGTTDYVTFNVQQNGVTGYFYSALPGLSGFSAAWVSF